MTYNISEHAIQLEAQIKRLADAYNHLLDREDKQAFRAANDIKSEEAVQSKNHQ